MPSAPNPPARDFTHDRNCFDLLRLIFASLVILSHAYELIDGNRNRELLTRVFHTISFGELAVDGFFVLSGFLITMSWEADKQPAAFLRKRVLRIYPGYAVAFLFSVFVVGPLGAPDSAAYFRHVHVVSDFKDLVLLKAPSTPPVFAGSYYPAVNGSLWTIRYEFICYLLLLALGVTGALRGRFVVVGLWAVSLFIFLAFRFTERHEAVAGAIAGGTLVTMVRFVPLFLAGAAMYKTCWHRRRPIWLVALALAVLVAGLFSKVTAEAALATAGAYLLLMFGVAVPKPPMFVKLPDISYGVYLYGWPLQKLLIFWGVSAPLVVFGLSLAMAACLGWVSWRIVEAPALRLKNSKAISIAFAKRWIASLRSQ
jgi:peptidoglycan/LPS O-acetylase OafA/YrhL